MWFIFKRNIFISHNINQLQPQICIPFNKINVCKLRKMLKNSLHKYYYVDRVEWIISNRFKIMSSFLQYTKTLKFFKNIRWSITLENKKAKRIIISILKKIPLPIFATTLLNSLKILFKRDNKQSCAEVRFYFISDIKNSLFVLIMS